MQIGEVNAAGLSAATLFAVAGDARVAAARRTVDTPA